MNKEELRNGILGASTKFARESITDPATGVTYEVMQPTVRQRAEIRSKSIKEGTTDVDVYEFQVLAVIELTVVPGTKERVFERSDKDVLYSLPTGGFIDDLFALAFNMCLVSDDSVKKHLKATENDSSCSG